MMRPHRPDADVAASRQENADSRADPTLMGMYASLPVALAIGSPWLQLVGRAAIRLAGVLHAVRCGDCHHRHRFSGRNDEGSGRGRFRGFVGHHWLHGHQLRDTLYLRDSVF